MEKKITNRNLFRFIALSIGFVLLFFIEFLSFSIHHMLKYYTPKSYVQTLQAHPPLYHLKERLEGTSYVLNPDWIGMLNYQEFPQEKHSGTYRIFCLGGSATYGYPMGAAYAWPRWLQAYLAALCPERTIEVINVGGDSMSSSRIFQCIDEILTYDPDMLLIYSGNNEFLEPAIIERANSQKNMITFMQEKLRYLYTYQIVTTLFAYCGFFSEKPLLRSITLSSDDEDEMFLYQVSLPQLISGESVEQTLRDRVALRDSISREDSELIYTLYDKNITTIVKKAHALRCKVLLLTVPTNCSDWAPILSWRDHEMTSEADSIASELRDFWHKRATFSEVPQLKDSDKTCSPLPLTFFIQGKIAQNIKNLHGQISTPSANELLKAARDSDFVPLRATDRINAIIKKIAKEEQCHFLNIEEIIERHSPHGICDNTYFWDYCHPNIEGHKLIARTLCQWFYTEKIPLSVHLNNEELSELIDRTDLIRIPSFSSPWTADMIAAMGYVCECIERYYLAKEFYSAALIIDPKNEFARTSLSRAKLLRERRNLSNPLIELVNEIDEDLFSVQFTPQGKELPKNH